MTSYINGIESWIQGCESLDNDILSVLQNVKDLKPLKPATDKDIEQAEKALKLSFAEDYKAMLKKYGLVIFESHEFTGVTSKGHRCVVENTKREREMTPYVSTDMYVIENPAIGGIIIWQDQSGSIYETRPEWTEAKQIADSLADYILDSNKK